MKMNCGKTGIFTCGQTSLCAVYFQAMKMNYGKTGIFTYVDKLVFMLCLFSSHEDELWKGRHFYICGQTSLCAVYFQAIKMNCGKADIFTTLNVGVLFASNVGNFP
jgi:uncharacterized protein involved in high-affinity Fe2+ transport